MLGNLSSDQPWTKQAPYPLYYGSSSQSVCKTLAEPEGVIGNLSKERGAYRLFSTFLNLRESKSPLCREGAKLLKKKKKDLDNVDNVLKEQVGESGEMGPRSRCPDTVSGCWDLNSD